MADFGAVELLAVAKKRYGERVLRDKIRGAEGEDQDATDDAADAQLLLMARAVIGRVETALQSSEGWPLPGVWPLDAVDETGTLIPPGTEFRTKWPYHLLQKALELFYAYVITSGEVASDNERRLLTSAERYFDRMEEGAPLGIGGVTDVGQPLVLTVRDRSGRSRVPGVSDNISLLEDMSGQGWDRNR